MIVIQKIIGLFVNIIGLFSKSIAGKIAMYFFTKPRKGYVNQEQSDFLDSAFQEKLEFKSIPIMTYRWLGSGKTILLVHGWESNAARWRYLIEPLKKQNYNIIALDAPAHGRSGSKFFTAILYADFIQTVSNKFKPDIIIGHSVGGMATAFFKNKIENLNINKLVLLGAPSEFTDVITRYSKMMSYSNRTNKGINELIQKRFGAKPDSFSTASSLENILAEGLIIHDEKDKVIPYRDAIQINNTYKNSRLISTKGFGHSLTDESISNHIYTFLES